MNVKTSQQPTMTPYFSEKLKVVSFLAIILVFYIHAGLPAEIASAMSAPVIARDCIAGVFGPCAVPMFYAISGYLFFYQADSVHAIFAKMRKRTKTLLIPFVIAACLYPLQPILKELILNVPAEKDYIALSQQYGLAGTVKALFYDSGTSMPWAYHLWFLRDLIIMVILAPCLYYLRQWAQYWSIAFPVVLYVMFPHIHFLYAMIWFLAGSMVLDRLGQLPRWPVCLMFGVFLLLSVGSLVYGCDHWELFRVLKIGLGVSSLWCLYDVLVSKDFRLSSAPLLSLACQFTFFLYLYHEPSFHLIVNGIPRLLGSNWLGFTLSVVLSPLIFAPIGIAVGYVFRKYLPKLYSILVGGRGS